MEMDPARIIAVIQRDNPAVLERAVLLVHIEDLTKQNADLKAGQPVSELPPPPAPAA